MSTVEVTEAPRTCATVFEFKYRDIIIRLIYLAAILCYVFDPDMIGSLMGRWLAGNVGILEEFAWKRLVVSSGVLLVFVAASIRTWATAYLRYDVMRNPKIRTDRLIADGPFGYLRNPLYVGNLFMVAGVSLMLSRTGALVLIISSFVFIRRLVAREEMELNRTHGRSFKAYCAAVPRWMPSLRRPVVPATYVPNYKNGITGELLAWFIALALAAYAATFDLKVFGAIFVCAFIPGAVRRMQRIRQRRNA
jgi:protein-S-isoprenylcysteine O-methyltransferase Ste14